MPIYTYRCKNCDHEFEIRQRMTDDPLRDCPVCQGEIRRVVNTVGVVFKGKGFYVTDNRSGSSAALPGSSGGKEEKGEKKSGGGEGSGGETAVATPAEKSSKPEKTVNAPAT